MIGRNTKKILKQFLLIAGFIWICVALLRSHSVDNDAYDNGLSSNTANADNRNIRQARGQRMPMMLDSSTSVTLDTLRQRIYDLNRPPDEKYAINETKSQQISVTRNIPDNRPQDCLNIAYNISELSTISVVIPMYNEAPSILLRTIHSILGRTPPELLADIIVVDDVSTNENMKEVLTDYIAQLSPKVKLLRLKKKAHLIKARMAGASVSTGDVLMFQDGHTEMNTGWAEPILEYLSRHPNTVIQPTVDSIDQWSIEYEDLTGSHDVWRGVFLWDMRYAWHRLPDKYRSWRTSSAEPVPCPVLVGCSIAVTRKYFTELGGFDTGLDIWGGEQIELSFKTWMCGGRVIIHPCSRVGHIYKPWMKSDVNWKKREVAIAKNNIRVAESWMERYATYYYASNRIYDFKRVELTEEDINGIAVRRAIKKKMGCKSFDWYLQNVLPEIREPPKGATYFGEVGNLASSMCLTVADDGYVALTLDCFLYSRLQEQGEFTFRDDGKLLYYQQCVMVDSYNLLKLVSCDQINSEHGAISFRLEEGHGLTQGRIILTLPAGSAALCLEQITNVLPPHNNEQMPQFRECKRDNSFQLWNVNYHFDYSLVPPPYIEGDVRFSS